MSLTTAHGVDVRRQHNIPLPHSASQDLPTTCFGDRHYSTVQHCGTDLACLDCFRTSARNVQVILLVVCVRSNIVGVNRKAIPHRYPCNTNNILYPRLGASQQQRPSGRTMTGQGFQYPATKDPPPRKRGNEDPWKCQPPLFSRHIRPWCAEHPMRCER